MIDDDPDSFFMRQVNACLILLWNLALLRVWLSMIYEVMKSSLSLCWLISSSLYTSSLLCWFWCIRVGYDNIGVVGWCSWTRFWKKTLSVRSGNFVKRAKFGEILNGYELNYFTMSKPVVQFSIATLFARIQVRMRIL